MHSLTPDGMDVIDEGLDIVNMYVYHASKDGKGIPAEMWKLIPHMMHVVAGQDKDVDGGFAFEFLSHVVVALQNIMQKDPQNFMSVGPDQTETYFEICIKFI